jgi:hypothetical protein
MSTQQNTTTTPAALRRGPVPRNSLRTIASIVGWLFIVTYVTSIAAKLAFYPPLFEGDYVTGPGQDTRVLWGAVFEVVLIIANIGTATYLWPVLKRQHESLAMSFVAARIMESVFIAVGVLSVLTVVTLRQDYAGAGAADGLTVAGDAFVTLQEWTFGLGPSFVVGVGNGVILGYLMYRSRLVPRKLAVLGLVGGPLIIVSGAAAMVGIIELDGTWQVLAAVPEFFWELGLGIYLVVKGFRPSPVTAGMDDER